MAICFSVCRCLYICRFLHVYGKFGCTRFCDLGCWSLVVESHCFFHCHELADQVWYFRHDRVAPYLEFERLLDQYRDWVMALSNFDYLVVVAKEVEKFEKVMEQRTVSKSHCGSRGKVVSFMGNSRSGLKLCQRETIGPYVKWIQKDKKINKHHVVDQSCQCSCDFHQWQSSIYMVTWGIY